MEEEMEEEMEEDDYEQDSFIVDDQQVEYNLR
jgi:hypothetical protein